MKFVTCCDIVISYPESATTVAGTQESKKQHTAEHPDISDALFYSTEVPECQWHTPIEELRLDGPLKHLVGCILIPQCQCKTKMNQEPTNYSKNEEIGDIYVYIYIYTYYIYNYTNLTVGGCRIPRTDTLLRKGITKSKWNSWCISNELKQAQHLSAFDFPRDPLSLSIHKNPTIQHFNQLPVATSCNGCISQQGKRLYFARDFWSRPGSKHLFVFAPGSCWDPAWWYTSPGDESQSQAAGIVPFLFWWILETSQKFGSKRKTK